LVDMTWYLEVWITGPRFEVGSWQYAVGKKG